MVEGELVAEHYWQARMALDAMPIEWDYGPGAQWPDTGWTHCLKEVAARAEWGRKLPKGHGQGIAVANWGMQGKPREGTTIAAVATVEVQDSGTLIVHAIDSAFDCGQMVNEDFVRAQLDKTTCLAGRTTPDLQPKFQSHHDARPLAVVLSRMLPDPAYRRCSQVECVALAGGTTLRSLLIVVLGQSLSNESGVSARSPALSLQRSTPGPTETRATHCNFSSVLGSGIPPQYFLSASLNSSMSGATCENSVMQDRNFMSSGLPKI